MSDSAEPIPAETIQQRILMVRGKRVFLDADLARFYEVTTFNLNKAVARNSNRFPEDFAFRLTIHESRALKFQSGISKSGRGGVRKEEIPSLRRAPPEQTRRELKQITSSSPSS